MARIGRRTGAAGTVLILGFAVGGSALATGIGMSDDEQALAPTRQPASRTIEQKVDALLSKMTTQEKLQQVQLLSDGQITDADAKAGVGSVFSLVDPVLINHYQHLAVEQSRLHIPILFAYDTIHGYRTIFPVPLGAASSFDPKVAQADAEVGAKESAIEGLKQVYSPMVDVSHEPRWGRIVEGAGEDPYLGSVMSAARVKGDQGTDYSAPDKVVASVKHYVAYGQPEGGRDYNTTDMSESRLRNFYLPPFKAAIDAGADTVMCSFNAINGVPGCANKYTETDILKKEWGFDGFIESDYTAVAELRACPPVKPDSGPCGHGIAADGPDAGAAALMAGTDSEMVSTNIRDYGQELLNDGRITMSRLDDAVRRILRVKFRAGLFDHPYVDVTKASDPASYGQPADLEKSRWAAEPIDGAAQERRQAAAARPQQVHGVDRAVGRDGRRDARSVVRTRLGPPGSEVRQPLRRAQGGQLGPGHLHRGLQPRAQLRPAEQRQPADHPRRRGVRRSGYRRNDDPGRRQRGQQRSAGGARPRRERLHEW